MLSQISRASRAVAARAVRANATQMRGFAASAVTRKGDNVQELYLGALNSYKIPPVKDSDAQGQVQIFSMPKTPVSPEETDLAQNLKAYSEMAVDIEGHDASGQSADAVATLPDWLEAEEEDDHHAH